VSELSTPLVLEITTRTLSVCGTALAVSLLLGLPIGVWLGRRRFRGRVLGVSLVNAGMGAPPVVVGLLVSMLLWRSGPLAALDLMYSPAAMVIAQIVIALPLVVGITLAAVGALDEDWELQVRALGIPPPQRAWLLVREIRLGVLAAVIAALGGILSEVGAVSAVGGNLEGETRVLTTAVLMYTQMGEFGLALSMAAVLLGMGSIVGTGVFGSIGIAAGVTGPSVVVAILLILLPVMGAPQTWLLYLFYFNVFLAAANMWNLLAGFSGLLALCPAAFIGLGGYTMTILTWLGIPYYVGIVVGGAVAALFAVIISIPVFRMRGVYFAIGTLVVPAILRLVFLRWKPVGGDFEGGGAGYMVKGVRAIPPEVTYWLALAIGLASVILVSIILRSKFGLGLSAIRDNDTSAASSGIDIFKIKLSSFIIAASVMGVAGAIFYMNQGYIEPSNAFDINWLMIVLLATVIGGKGLEWGPLIGTAIVVVLRFQLARYAGISLLIQGLILVVIMLVAPHGIMGLIGDLGKKFAIYQKKKFPSSS